MKENDKDGGKRKEKRSPFTLPDRLTESYIMTTAHRNVGIYGERFIDVIVQAVKMEQKQVEFLSGGIIDLQVESDGARKITFSTKRLMANALDTNFPDAEEALRKLESLFFEYRSESVWKSRALITDPEIDEVNHTATIRIPAEIWEAVGNRSEGFRLYNPQVGLRVSSDYAYRIYKIIAGQKYPLSYMIADLKAMLGIKDKYKRLADFLARVIDPAREALIKYADWYFDYKLGVSKESQEMSKRGRPAYDKITFYGKVNLKNTEKSDLQNIADMHYQGDISRLLPADLLDYLKNKYQFTEKEIRNSHVIPQAYDILKNHTQGLLDFLKENTVRIDGAQNKKAYLVKMVKTHVAERFGVVLGNPGNPVKVNDGVAKKDGKDLGDLADLVSKT